MKKLLILFLLLPALCFAGSIVINPAATTSLKINPSAAKSLNIAPALVFEVRTTSSPEDFALPLVTTGSYNFEVDWGDGSNDTITAYNQSEVTHSYTSSGSYTIKIVGEIYKWSFNNNAYKDMIYDLSSWGSLQFGDEGANFYGCSNLTVSAPSISTTTSRCTSFRAMFSGATSANPDVSNWDTSSGTSFRSMFYLATSATPDVSNWDTSSCENLYRMFYGATLANPDVSNWDVSLLTDAFQIFNYSGWTTTNYDAMLISWSAQSLNSAVTFNAGTTQYSAGAAATAKGVLEGAPNLWVITDGGQAP